MIVDVSHCPTGVLGYRGAGTRPFADQPLQLPRSGTLLRNLTDEMIRVMAEKGGLVGLNYCSGFLDDQPRPELCRSDS